MTAPSPLLATHQRDDALTEPYGPPERGIALVQTFSNPDLEYAAIRRGSGLIDLPHRATLEVSGNDRLDFLGRMLTQELKDLTPFSSRSAFWLSRKGRIDADLRITCLPDRILIDLDAHAADRALKGLSAYIITEDCAIADRSAHLHRLALHGPSGPALLHHASTPVAGDPVLDLQPGRASIIRIADADITVDRDDHTGDPGLLLTLPADRALAVWSTLLALGFPPSPTPPRLPPSHRPSSPPFHLRPIGWAAFNIARIEAGTPLFYLDFGPDSLPHETSLLDSRVSFTKGCYLGQEIVARMQALGTPKQRLVSLRLPAPTPPHTTDPTADADLLIAPQPITGAAVFLPPASPADAPAQPAAPPSPASCGDPVGAVTSSAISPMLGGAPICFAMMKSAAIQPGRQVLVECEGSLLSATIQPTLRSWSRP